MASNNGIAVARLPAAAGADAELLDELAELINGVYATAESGLWRAEATRTTRAELADLIAAGELIAATRDERVLGSVRLHDVADDLSEFGLLVAEPEERGTGVGNALLTTPNATAKSVDCDVSWSCSSRGVGCTQARSS